MAQKTFRYVGTAWAWITSVTDRRTDGQTDGRQRAVSNSTLICLVAR